VLTAALVVFVGNAFLGKRRGKHLPPAHIAIFRSSNQPTVVPA
jgi:hypothetical protein